MLNIRNLDVFETVLEGDRIQGGSIITAEESVILVEGDSVRFLSSFAMVDGLNMASALSVSSMTSLSGDSSSSSISIALI
jgi:hypothetical protein